MRLDKFLSITGSSSRSESAKAARAGRITVNGVAIKNTSFSVDPEQDVICLDGMTVIYRKYTYVMLNKPEGYVSATEDGRDPTVIELLPEQLQKLSLFPCGRLDKNTLGLMLLTDNGELAHRMLSPKRHVEKKYRFECRSPVSDEDRNKIEDGIRLADGYITKPAELDLFEDRTSGVITLHEGKYHQIKRMFGAVNDNRIVYLERISFGPLVLDKSLSRGEWRYLTSEEISEIESL